MGELPTVIPLLNALTDVSVKDFDNRLRAQKLTFLAQELGFDSGFSFNFYANGPYSPSLARVLFSAEALGVLRKATSLSKEDKVIVDRLKDFLKADINDARALELIASAWYLLPPGKLSQSQIEETASVLGHEKPKYNRREILDTIERIIRFR